MEPATPYRLDMRIGTIDRPLEFGGSSNTLQELRKEKELSL